MNDDCIKAPGSAGLRTVKRFIVADKRLNQAQRTAMRIVYENRMLATQRKT
jgi:hypothetical protein